MRHALFVVCCLFLLFQLVVIDCRVLCVVDSMLFVDCVLCVVVGCFVCLFVFVVTRCSLFVVSCSLFVARCLCVLCVGCCSSLGVNC